MVGMTIVPPEAAPAKERTFDGTFGPVKNCRKLMIEDVAVQRSQQMSNFVRLRYSDLARLTGRVREGKKRSCPEVLSITFPMQ